MSFLNTSYNKCALVIGINYTGIQGAELNGCITDTKRISDFLIDRCSYSDNNIDLLTDDTLLKPTKQNIINAIKKFVQKIKDDDIREAWFSYSGHGSYLNNNSIGDEQDNQDEALVPLDYFNSGLIRDDELYNLMVKMIPKTCTLFAIVDACHSGTSLDLPYVYRTDSGLQKHRNEENLANILKISGCRDTQTSADAFINGKYQGALTFSFLKTMDELDYNFTSKQLVSRVKKYLNENGYPQIPTLSLSDESLLDELLMGDNIDGDYNINIYMEGDAWCNLESSWNILSLKDNSLIFSRDKKFYTRNDKINFKLNLQDGRYILVLKDSYGDGGIKGNISYIKNSNNIKDFIFAKGTYKSIDFEVGGENDLNTNKKKIRFEINCDYYGLSESKWNVIDSLGNNVFPKDKVFDKSNDKQNIDIELEEGNYQLKCSDTYGDGGIDGKVIRIIDNKSLLSFKWSNLNWSNNDGYQQLYNFKV